MDLKTLERGNSLLLQQMETRNSVAMLEKWIKELEKDATVVISSYTDPNISIIEIHGTKVLPFVERRLTELKEDLEELEKEFNSL